MSPLPQRATVAPIVTLVAVLLLPYGYTVTIGLGSANYIVIAIFWEFVSSFYFTGLRLVSSGAMLAGIIYTLVRFALVYQVYRFYRGSATRGQTLLLAVVSELPPLILSIPAIMGSLIMPAPFFEYVIPVPTMLLLAVILLFAFPQKQASVPW